MPGYLAHAAVAAGLLQLEVASSVAVMSAAGCNPLRLADLDSQAAVDVKYLLLGDVAAGPAAKGEGKAP